MYTENDTRDHHDTPPGPARVKKDGVRQRPQCGVRRRLTRLSASLQVGSTARRHGNADLRSAPPAEGGRKEQPQPAGWRIAARRAANPQPLTRIADSIPHTPLMREVPRNAPITTSYSARTDTLRHPAAHRPDDRPGPPPLPTVPQAGRTAPGARGNSAPGSANPVLASRTRCRGSPTSCPGFRKPGRSPKGTTGRQRRN